MSIGLATKGVINIMVSAGGSYPDPVPSCDPDAAADEVGALHLDATIIEEDIVDITPGIYPTTSPDPIEGEEVLPTERTLPLPSNL